MAGDGSLRGADSGWPAIQDAVPSGKPGDLIFLRPSPGDALRVYELSIPLKGEKGALADYRRALRGLAARRMAKKAEEKRTGVAAATVALEALYEQERAIQRDIEALSPTTPNAAAARILIEAMAEADFREPASSSDAVAVALIALEHLRPALRGIIAAHVDELLDNPDIRLGSSLAYVGDSDGGIVATEVPSAA
jgi:hypothetical protein